MKDDTFDVNRCIHLQCTEGGNRWVRQIKTKATCAITELLRLVI